MIDDKLDVVEGEGYDLGAEGGRAQGQEGVKLEKGDSEEVVLTKGRAGGPDEPFFHLGREGEGDWGSGCSSVD